MQELFVVYLCIYLLLSSNTYRAVLEKTEVLSSQAGMIIGQEATGTVSFSKMFFWIRKKITVRIANHWYRMSLLEKSKI